jgi:hypothetical protein
VTFRTDARVAAPFAWPKVNQVTVTLGSGPTLQYALGPACQVRDEAEKWRRDDRGRLALEAFGALPLSETYRRLESHAGSLGGRDRVRVEQARLQVCFAELVAFVLTFGPLGFDWPRTFEVRNRAADEARDELAELEYARIPEIGPEAARAAVIRNRVRLGLPRWQVTFPGVGEAGPPEVTEIPPFRGLPGVDNVELDDTPRQDFLGFGPPPTGSGGGPIWRHRDELLAALQIVEAIAADDADAIREPLGQLPGSPEVPVGEVGARAPVGIHWQDAMVGDVPSDGRWAPFRERPGQVKWIEAGRLGLADFLSFQIAWSGLGLGLGVRQQFRVRSMVGSILELIYLQLVEHLERRPDMGVGTCGYCKGPILRVRLRQLWHRGCSPAGRKRRSRAMQAAGMRAADEDETILGDIGIANTFG